jgi:hypothetical protein
MLMASAAPLAYSEAVTPDFFEIFRNWSKVSDQSILTVSLSRVLAAILERLALAHRMYAPLMN